MAGIPEATPAQPSVALALTPPLHVARASYAKLSLTQPPVNHPRPYHNSLIGGICVHDGHSQDSCLLLLLCEIMIVHLGLWGFVHLGLVHLPTAK